MDMDPVPGPTVNLWNKVVCFCLAVLTVITLWALYHQQGSLEKQTQIFFLRNSHYSLHLILPSVVLRLPNNYSTNILPQGSKVKKRFFFFLILNSETREEDVGEKR